MSVGRFLDAPQLAGDELSSGGDGFVYVGPWVHLARRKFYWSPPRLARCASSFLTTRRGQIELHRIFSLPAFRESARRCSTPPSTNRTELLPRPGSAAPQLTLSCR